MDVQIGDFVIVYVGVMQLCIVEIEVQWFDQVQGVVGIGGKVNVVVCIWWDFWLEEDDMEYVGILLVCFIFLVFLL